MDEAVRRAASMTAVVQDTGGLRACISAEGPEEFESSVVPYIFETVMKQIPQPEFFYPEKQIAGIDRTIRQQTQLGCACRASYF